MFVKPARGLLVRDPDTKFPLPAEGREVQPTSYWLRRVACGDVELIEAPQESRVITAPATSSSLTEESTP